MPFHRQTKPTMYLEILFQVHPNVQMSWKYQNKYFISVIQRYRVNAAHHETGEYKFGQSGLFVLGKPSQKKNYLSGGYYLCVV